MSKKKSSASSCVAITMGSDSDYPMMKEAAIALERFKIPYSIQILSAHRTPQEVSEFAQNAVSQGIRVIIAGAGGAAHLPGMIAAQTPLPVIGVPIAALPSSGFLSLQGEDALYSIVQMPRGIPVATLAINNAWNAGILAVQILSAEEQGLPTGKRPLQTALLAYKESLRKEVLSKKLPHL